MNTFTHAGYTIKIEQDQDAENPREDFDHFGKMVCWHNRYQLGDKSDFSDVENFQDWWKQNGKGGVILSLYLYDHSGITMRCEPFSCPWDSGQVGWIYATADAIRKEHSVTRITKAVRAKVEKYLRCEVEEYDQYLTGDVWNYTVEDENGAHVDSCCGFYGHEYCESEAKGVAERVAKNLVTACLI